MKIYHTETQEDYDELLEKMKKEGNHWWPNKVIKPNDSLLWEVHEENTVIYVEEEEISYGAIPYAKAQYPNIPIEKYEASIQEEEEEEEEEDELKIYHVETQEDFGKLMFYLENTGCTWESGEPPTSNKRRVWGIHGHETIIRVNNSKISLDNIRFCMREYPETEIEPHKAKKTETTDPIEEFATAWNKAMKSHLIEFTDASDNVNNPAHYTAGGIETLDYIKAKVKDYHSYAVGNILKYVSRYEHKNGIEDLKKAQFYLNDLIKAMEKGA